MKATRALLIFPILFLFIIQTHAQEYRYLQDETGLKEVSPDNGIEQAVTISIVYDNYVKVKGLQSDWGYSILIEGLDKTILFDTGAKPDIFESNFRKMDLDAGKVDYLVLSHEHADHTGGLPAFVKMKKDIPVLIPQSFTERFKESMVKSGLEPLLVNKPVKICTDLYSSGEFAGPIPEQAIVLNTKKGLVVMTGCSHPGILEMIERIKSDFNKNVYMVFGGFHLMDKSDDEINSIISSMKASGVIKCGATHCTGKRQIKLFRDSFSTNFIEMGSGNSFIIN